MQITHNIDHSLSGLIRAEDLVRLQIKALEEAANAIVITDHTGTVIWANNAFERLTGYTTAEIVGQSTRLLKSGLNPRELYEEMWRTILGKNIWRGELTNRRKDGRLYDEEMTITPVCDHVGKVTNYIAIKLDISARKESEAKHRELTGRLSLATEVAKLGVWEWDLLTNTFVWDATLFGIYGFEPMASIPYERWSAVVHPEDLPAVEATLRRAISERKQGSAEFRIISADGSVRNVSAAGRVVLDKDGTVTRVLGTAQDITERKRSEERVNTLARAVECTSELIAVTDSDLYITFVNRALLNALRYSKEEDIVGKQIAAVMSPSNPSDLFSQITARTLDTGEWSGECLLVRANGEDFPVLLNTNVVQNSAGRPVGTLGIAQDITERKRTEQDLRNSESKHRVLFEDSADAHLLSDETGFVDCNAALLQMFGYASKNELIALRPHDLSPPNQADGTPSQTAAEENIANAFLTGQNRFEWLHRRRDGEVFPAEVCLTALTLNGRPMLLGTVLDISKRKKMEDKLRRLAAIVESSDDAIISKALDGTIETWNGGAERMYGYLAAEAIGKSISMLCPPGHADEIPALLEKVGRGEIVEHFETFRLKKGGKQIRIILSLSPIRDASGTIIGISAISRDITQLKQLEEMFRQAQKMEAVGRLAGGIAHDFNNLLSVIIGYSEMLLERTDADGRERQQYEEIKRAGDRAASLTRQMLAFSRQQVLDPKVLNLNTCVVEIEKMIRRLIGEDIDLQTCLDPTLDSVKADAGQIEQIIMNLVVNARDAMPSGGQLVIETSNAELDDEYALRHTPCIPGRYVLLSVTDSGVGMNEETMAHIFEPFFTTKEVGKGTGLGLSTVFGVVKQSDGHISVYSELGRGTIFKIYLPRVDGAELQIQPTQSAPELLRGTETVLLVEDEPSVRALTRKLLEDSGYTVLEADNGVHAIDIAKQHRGGIHLLLTDVVMPGMNGPSLAESILLLQPEVKVLYVSGYSGKFGSQTGLVPAGASLLQKPFSRTGLLLKLRNVLEAQKKSEQLKGLPSDEQ